MRNNKKFSGNAVFVLALLVILSGTISMSDSGGSKPVDTCADGIDNDGDGYADGQDGECAQGSPYYDGEENDATVPNQPPSGDK